MADLRAIQKKWAHYFKEKKPFEADAASGKPKFFVTFPYPYMNGYLHMGHLYTIMRVEALARYKRHMGYHVLFPQGWHCTGSPIETAALRIREKEEKQWAIMRDMGFSDKEIEKFSDPVHWTRFFPVEAKKDCEEMGLSIDFRRSFITTELNPYYDKFIRWQFNKLKEKGLVVKGKHPVVWDPIGKCPVGDHDRSIGEGETPQEFTLLKFAYGNEFVIAATLRPETIFGQTNLWVGPEIEYVKAKVGNEIWIISKPCVDKLRGQEKEVEIVGTLSGKELLLKKVTSLAIHKELFILPSNFCDESKGTGIVTSVPSDAPDDYMGLFDLQKDAKLSHKYGVDKSVIDNIHPIPIIDTPELGNLPAKTVCEQMKIQSQNDRLRLEEAKQLVYKKGFYDGVMNASCGAYAGMKVQKAKDLIKAELLEKNAADIMYELTGKVVSRSLHECVVKVVSNQWFINYADPAWKKEAFEALANCKLYPELSRKQFEYVVDWLNAWACSREYGLGTKLPWDEEWVIESLSDSTIYMAYYTITHLLQHVPLEKVDDALFDYVFLGIGKAPTVPGIDAMRKEFDYWYPLDFRNSGKDLIQNHLTFFLFNHTAIFPKEKWPKGIGVNGWVTVNGEKMSKSKGNFVLLKEVPEKFTVDAARFTILCGGEGVDDANWDSALAMSMQDKLSSLPEFISKYYNTGVQRAPTSIDAWFESVVNEILRDTIAHMEETEFRSALQRAFFDLQKEFRWYLRRCDGQPNRSIMDNALELQVLLLAPICPFLCEDIWESIGKKGLISLAAWPKVDPEKIKAEYTIQESIIETIMEDIRTVKKIVKVEQPKKITLYVAEEWKYQVFHTLRPQMQQSRDIRLLQKTLADSPAKTHMAQAMQILPRLIKSGIPKILASSFEEHIFLEKEKAFLAREFQCEIEIVRDGKDAQAQKAMPSKPSLSLL